MMLENYKVIFGWNLFNSSFLFVLIVVFFPLALSRQHKTVYRCALYNEIIICHIMCRQGHDDVIKWKHFPRYWPFFAGNSPVNSPHKDQWRGALFFLWSALNKRLSKQSWGWWFETQSRPLWHHCNARKTAGNVCLSPEERRIGSDRPYCDEQL